jgi:hypothetical protein
MKRFFLLLALLALIMASTAEAQKHNNIWHFGYGTGLDFNTNPPTSIGGFTNVLEGTASIAHPHTGELLFVSDGSTIWDRNGIPMPSAPLLDGGSGTSTQAVTIIPVPFDTNRYLLIVADQGGYTTPNKGVSYLVIDMSLRGGLGDVALQPQLLFPPRTCEKMTAVLHADGCGIWLIAQSYEGEFLARAIRDTLFDADIVRSKVGFVPRDVVSQGAETIGYLVANRAGDKLAAASMAGPLEIYDFDRATGKVSNALRLETSADEPYGVCFSPDGTKLYATTVEGSSLRQFDLSVPRDQIAMSRLTFGNNVGGVIRPGPDGKLYVPSRDGAAICVIERPNERGVACDLRMGAIPPTLGSPSVYGLPNILDALMDIPLRPCAEKYARVSMSTTIACVGDCITFSSFVGFRMRPEWRLPNGEIIRDSQSVDLCITEPGEYSIELFGINDDGDTARQIQRFVVNKAGRFNMRPQMIISDTIGDVLKIPIILSDTLSALFTGTFAYDAGNMIYLGSFDQKNERIDQGSEPGLIHINTKVTTDSIIGWMYFQSDFSETECFEIDVRSSAILGSGVNCLSSALLSGCLTSACGSQAIYDFMETDLIRVSIAPNPSSDRIELFSDHSLEEATVILHDMNGATRQMDKLAAGERSVNVTHLENGVYFLTIRTQQTAIRKMFVVRR